MSCQVRDEILYIAKNSDAAALNLIGHLYLFMDSLISTSVRQHSKPGGKVKDFLYQGIPYLYRTTLP